MDLSLLTTDFKEEYFRFIIDKYDLTDDIEKMLNKKEVKKFNFIEADKDFFITFNQKQYKIPKNPVCFKSFLDKNIILFRIFTEENLNSITNLLKSTYLFFDKENNIIKIENIKFDSTKEIFLVPFIYSIFVELSSQYIDLKELKEEDFDFIEIDPFILEPYYALIDEEKTASKFNFIKSQERINFIEEILEYIKLNNTYEPMVIIGNDGIGKSVSLQYLSNFNLDFPILYFNFKFMENNDLIEYICLEIMRGFVNKKNVECNNLEDQTFSDNTKKNFGKYIDFLKNFKEIASNKSFWEILEIIFKDDLLKKSILIIDQFKNESKFYNGYDKFISFNKNRKIILCYTLNDSYNKETLFSMLNNTTSNNIFKNYFYESKESNQQIEKNDDDNQINKEEEDVDETDFFKKFTIFQNALDSTINLDTNHNNKIKKEDKEIQKESFIELKEDNILLAKKRKKTKTKKVNKIVKEMRNEIEKQNQRGQMQASKKIYYNSLVNIEDMIQDINVKECLSYFSYSPKYYSKFLKFQQKQEKNNVINIKDIIQKFYNEQFEKIYNNINKFYFNINKKLANDKLPFLNQIESLIKLKKVVENGNKINFFKLSEYSKKFCFKYLQLSECINKENYYIDLNEKDNNKVFTLNYSSLFVKIAIEKIINNLLTTEFVEINHLSGSAFGNVLELKFKEDIVENKYFNTTFINKKVWNFEQLDNKLKNTKFKEYLAKKKNNNNPKFHIIEELDDILNEKFTLNDKYYYFNPKNQTNKYFDSLMLIKTNQDREFNMIIFQHTKYKDESKIKKKNDYRSHAENEVKVKFEKLYNINIKQIFFLFILSNEDIENEDTCKILDKYKIAYLFYSIRNREIYKSRSKEKIKLLGELMNPNYLIFPIDNDNNNDSTFNIKTINSIENIIREKLEKGEKINYEKIRNDIIPHSVGPIINDDLKRAIISKINSIKNTYDSLEFLYYASIPYSQITVNNLLQEDLFFILKIDNVIYLYYDNKNYIINITSKSIKESKSNLLDLFILIHNDKKNIFIKNDDRYELKNIPDLKKGNTNIFLFKIYKISLKTNTAKLSLGNNK